ncbi:MAG: MBL fold metallo-hydrolase [Patescibacteria group bacterium]
MFSRDRLILIGIFLIIFDFFVWSQIVLGGPNKNLEVYFLDVGQGDSQLVNLPSGVQVLIDGGPNKKVLNELSSVLAPTDRYIDLVILSHPQYDHFAGLIEVLKRYKVGAFIYNGREGEAKSFADLKKALKENKIPEIILAGNDKIKYQDSRFDILSPTSDFLKSSELNDTTLVMKLGGLNSAADILFTGDIGKNVEDYLAKNFDIKADILKVGHHGSKFSSGEEFLKKIGAKIAVIEVGKNNYGHPTVAALNRLTSAGARIFRTDNDGTIKLIINDRGMINIFKNK